MSATLTREGGWVQHEQSDMRRELYMAKMPTGGSSCATIEETQHLPTKARAEVKVD